MKLEEKKQREQERELIELIGSALEPTKFVSLDKWMTTNRYISEGNAEAGLYTFRRTPYLKEIAYELSRKKYKKIAVMKTSQLGFTELGVSWALYSIIQDPSTMYYMTAKAEETKEASKIKFESALRMHPEIQDKIIIDAGGHKNKNNTISLKRFVGGFLRFVGGLRINAYKTHSVKNIIMDEADEFPMNIQGQGDPLKLLQDRSSTYYDSMIFCISTPTEHITGDDKSLKKSLIYTQIENTEWRKYFVPCPHCKEYQPLEFENLQHTKNADEDVICEGYKCVACKKIIKEKQKEKMLIKGEWRATKKSKDKKTLGLHINALYSPAHWKSWQSCCVDYYDALDDLEKDVYFHHNVLGVPYQTKITSVKPETLHARREVYHTNPIHENKDESLRLPEGIFMLIASADVHKNRIEVLVKGYGIGFESWVIQHHILPAQTSTALVHDPVWNNLLTVINYQYRLYNNKVVMIERLAIDIGYNSSQVAQFIKKYKPFIIGVRGLERGAISWVKNKSLRLEHLEVNTSDIKINLYSRLEIQSNQDREEGMLHFPTSISSMEHYRQLLSEKPTLNKRKQIIWEKIRSRNEVLDLHVYADAVAKFMKIDLWNADRVNNFLLQV